MRENIKSAVFVLDVQRGLCVQDLSHLVCQGRDGKRLRQYFHRFAYDSVAQNRVIHVPRGEQNS